MNASPSPVAACHRHLDESSRHLQHLCSDYLALTHQENDQVSALQKQLQAERREIKNAWQDQLAAIKDRETALEVQRSVWLKQAMREISNVDQQLRSEQLQSGSDWSARFKDRCRAATTADATLLALQIEKAGLYTTINRVKGELRRLQDKQLGVVHSLLTEIESAASDYCNRHTARNRAIDALVKQIDLSVAPVIQAFCENAQIPLLPIGSFFPEKIRSVLIELEQPSADAISLRPYERLMQDWATELTQQAVSSIDRSDRRLIPAFENSCTLALYLFSLATLTVGVAMGIHRLSTLIGQGEPHPNTEIQCLPFAERSVAKYSFDPKEPFYVSHFSGSMFFDYLSLYQSALIRLIQRTGVSTESVYQAFRSAYDPEKGDFNDDTHAALFPIVRYQVAAPDDDYTPERSNLHASEFQSITAATQIGKKLGDLAWCAVRGLFNTSECPIDIPDNFLVRVVHYDPQSPSINVGVNERRLLPVNILLDHHRVCQAPHHPFDRWGQLSGLLPSVCSAVLSLACVVALRFGSSQFHARRAELLHQNIQARLLDPTLSTLFEGVKNLQGKLSRSGDALRDALRHSAAHGPIVDLQSANTVLSGPLLTPKRLVSDRQLEDLRRQISETDQILSTQSRLNELRIRWNTIRETEVCAKMTADARRADLDKWVAAADRQSSRSRAAKDQRARMLTDIDAKLHDFSVRAEQLDMQRMIFQEAAAANLQQHDHDSALQIVRLEKAHEEQRLTHPIHRFSEVGLHLDAVMDGGAWERVHQRHIEISDDALVDRVRCGRFTNPSDELIHAHADRAGSYTSFAHALGAIGDAVQAVIRHPAVYKLGVYTEAENSPDPGARFQPFEMKLTVTHPEKMGRIAISAGPDAGEGETGPLQVDILDSQSSVVSFRVTRTDDIKITHLYPC